jgi:hypothetical protein
MEGLFRRAEEYLKQGFSVIPVMLIPESGRKVALVDWKKYQLSPPTLEELKEWFIKADFPALRSGFMGIKWS